MTVVLVLIVLSDLFTKSDFFYIKKLKVYGDSKGCFSLEEIFSFDWDEGYFDGSNYGRAEHLKERYGFDVEVSEKTTVEKSRFIF